MAYSVTTNDGVTISVADEAKDSSSLSLTVIGRNATNYGQSIVTNTVRQLENFASNVPPSPTYKLTGQLWYNKSEDNLRVYDGTVWNRVSKVPVASSDLSTDLVAGTQYFNSTEDKLKVYDGGVFKNAVVPGGTVTSAYSGNVTASGSASNYGAKVETLFLESTDSTAKVIPVVAIKYVSDGVSLPGELADADHDSAGATVMAVFSDRAFTLDANDPHYATLSDSNSFGATFTKGMNLRADYSDSSIALSDKAEWADKANAIFTGTVIPAADIIHVNSTNWVPGGTVSGNYTLGTSTNRFGDLHVDQAQIGNPSTPQTVGIIGQVNIGNVTNEVNEIFVHDLHVSGDLDFAAVNTLTNLESADIDDVTLTSGTISTSPSGANDIANKSYVDTKAAAATAATVTLVATNTTNSTHYLTFVDTATGNEQVRTDTGIQYNPSTNTLTTSVFSGTTGSFSGAVSAASSTFSGAVSAASGSYSGTVSAGTFSGTTGSFSGTVSAGTLSDGSATISGGVFSGVSASARYADLAEKYEADADYEPGTVVKIGGEKEITMTMSHADIEVFGVISTDPAYIMNNDIDGLPVALQGRVPVKVIGKVKKGERLTTSDVPGVAWGVADEEVPLQAIIGRALENKDDGDQGVVEAVIGVK